MASPSPKPRKKRLAEFLKEQQEPFTLDLYLLERGYPTNRTPNGDNKRDPLFPLSKLLTTLHKKLLFHNQSCILIRDSDIINQHVHVTVPHEAESTDQTIDDTDRFSFSTATNSTVYLSCSDIDEDGTSFSPHNKDKALVQSQQATDSEKHRQRRLEGGSVPESRNISVTHGTLNQDGREERVSNCCVLVPKKMAEDSLLSVALWSSLIQSAKREKCSKELRELLGANPNVCHVLKSKTLLHKAKQLLFYCVREISINVSRKDCREQCLKQPQVLRKIIWDRTRELSENETNLTNLLSLDWIDEWSEFKPQVRHICVEVADAVLERVIDQFVAEMSQVFLAPTL
ncbi:hypothetical protein CR513_13319, partial [Mucuna pruriens]